MKIAVDAMGGDNAPAAIVQGGLDAARIADGDFEVVFVGDESQIHEEIERHHFISHLPIHVVHASEVIEMHESPSTAIKRKKDSSIVVCQRLQREGKVDAVVSAGHTGAAMASALIILGRLPGVHRPAVGSVLPSSHGFTFVIDVGANVGARASDLQQFGIMGSIFVNQVMGVEEPRVGLLNIGEEPTKGSHTILKAYELLANSPIHFIGNVEGRDILKGKADVVVCDGFVGNVLLKFAESVGGVFSLYMKKHIGKKIISNLGAFLLKPTFRGLRKIWSYEEYGGAPLLGVKGVVIIGHGSSTPRAITNAILEAAKMVQQNVNEKIKTEMQTLNGVEIVTEKA
ncbi:MAG: phosphate acyltransferase PlsX [Calditrichaeota bacterium]|nr:MAG: phosphate acyltransferase PlsX [Calditrichota bacterium]